MIQLKRQLRFWDSVAINVGIIIGVGIFRVPSEVAKHISSVPLTLFAWALGGLISLLGVLCYAELSSRIPQTGGTYAFLREGYGKLIGFLFGWTEIGIMRAGSIAAVAYVFSDYFLTLVPVSTHFQKPIIIFMIGILTFVNILGVQSGAKVQKVISFMKVGMIILLAGAIFWFIWSGNQPSIAQTNGHLVSPNLFRNLGAALIPIFFTFGGWHESTFMSGEFHDSKKELPVSLIASILIVTLVYLMINVSYLCMIPPAEMIHHSAVASEVLQRIFGTMGKQLASLLVLISSFGALNSTILTGGRIPFALAHDFPKFQWFGKVDDRWETPLRSLALNGIWASVLVLWGNFEQLLFFSQFGFRVFFALAGISIFLIRSKHKNHEGFSMLGYPVVPVLFSLSSVWICAVSFQYAPRESLFGALLILAGIPVYYLVRPKPVLTDKVIV